MGTICEANTVVKCVHSGTHNTFIISREHHQVPLRGNIELHREPSSTLELSRRSLTTLLSHCHQPSSYTTIRSPPRNIAASEHTTVRSALLITTTAESNLLERRAKRCGVRRPPLTTLETTYAERCFPPLSHPSHRSHLSHRTPPPPTAEKVARRASFKMFARTNAVCAGEVPHIVGKRRTRPTKVSMLRGTAVLA
jgi:hypothetical protein